VSDAERSVPPVVGAARGGDRRAALEALRDHLAVALVEVDARYKAPLAKQLSDVLRDLDGLPDVRKASPVDDLTAARVARRKAVGID